MTEYIAQWPTRKQVADALGVSPTTIRRLEDAGQLHPVKDSSGCNRFDPSEVESARLARSETTAAAASSSGAGSTSTPTTLDGELAALIFEELEQGLTPTDIVREHAISPQLVSSAVTAYHHLRELGGSAPDSVQRLELLEQALSQRTAEVFALSERLAAVERYIYFFQLQGGQM